MLILLSLGGVSVWVSTLVLQKQKSDAMFDSSQSFFRRTFSCEFGNSALLSNEVNDSEVLSIGGDSFPEISAVASIKKRQRFSSSDQTLWRKKSKR